MASVRPHHRPRRRVRPHRKYRAGLGFRRWVSRFQPWARVHGIELHGSRLYALFAALAVRQPQVQSDIVYVSAGQLEELTGLDERTMRRAIADLVLLAGTSPIEVTRPNPCDGDRPCRYEKRPCPGFHGGKTLDEDGRAVGAANGFSVNQAWIESVRALRTAPSRPAGQPTKAERQQEYEAARRRLQQQQAASPAPDAPPSRPDAPRPEAGGGPLAGTLTRVVAHLGGPGRGP